MVIPVVVVFLILFFSAGDLLAFGVASGMSG